MTVLDEIRKEAEGLSVQIAEICKKYLSMIDRDFVSKDIASIIRYINEIEDTYLKLKSHRFPEVQLNLEQRFHNSLKDEYAAYEEKKKLLNVEFEEKKKVEEENKQLRISKAIQDYQSLDARYRQMLTGIYNLQNELRAKKDKIEFLMQMYDIPARSDLIDLDKVALADLEKSLQIAYNAIKVHLEGSPYNILKWLYYPNIMTKKSDTQDTTLTLIHFGTLVFLLLILKPYAMGIIGFTYVTAFLGNFFSIKEKKVLIQAIYSLISEIDLEYFIEREAAIKSAKKLIDREKNFDLDEVNKELNRKKDQELAKLGEENPAIKYQTLLDEAYSKISYYNDTVERIKKLAELERSNTLSVFNKHLADIDLIIEELNKNFKFIGEEIQASKSMKRVWATSYLQIREKPIFNAEYDLPGKSMLFVYKTEEERKEMIKFMKVLLCNQICCVREKCLKINIQDPIGLGMEFSEFFSEEINAVVTYSNKSSNELLKSRSDEGIKRVQELLGQPIDEYNAEAESVGKITKPYEINIVVSDNEHIWQTNQYISLTEKSETTGIMFWYLLEEPVFKETRGGEVDEKKRAFSILKGKNIMCYNPYVLYVTPDKYIQAAKDTIPYVYTEELINRTIKTLAKNIRDSRADVLFYKQYIDNIITPDKYWTGDTTKGIKLYVGYKNGDPSQPYYVELGDRNVAMLMGGTSGSGKSAFINQCLATLMLMYPPESLMLVLIDFKIVEFAVFQGPYSIPHAQVTAGTKNGAYAVSVYNWVMAEMKRRQDTYKEASVKNIIEYNTKMENIDKKKKQPRILLIFDEVEAMFRSVSRKDASLIENMVTRLAAEGRSMGIHQVFASQTIEKAVTSEIFANFRARLALKVTKESAVKLVGDEYPSTFDGPGKCIINLEIGETPERNTLCVTPYIPTEELKQIIVDCNDRCKRDGNIHRHSSVYDEEKVHLSEELELTFKEIAKTTDLSVVCPIVLGRRTLYSQKDNPYAIQLTNDAESHVFHLGTIPSDLVTLAKTFMYNGLYAGKSVIISCSDRTLIQTLGDLPTGVMLIEDYEKLVSVLDTVVEKQAEMRANGQITKNFYVIMLGADMYQGLTIDGKRNAIETLRSEKMKLWGEAGIHLFIQVKSMEEFLDLAKKPTFKIATYAQSRDYERMTDQDLANLRPNMMYLKVRESGMQIKMYKFPDTSKVVKLEFDF